LRKWCVDDDDDEPAVQGSGGTLLPKRPPTDDDVIIDDAAGGSATPPAAPVEMALPAFVDGTEMVKMTAAMAKRLIWRSTMERDSLGMQQSFAHT
jgi:hypothetical protein